MRTIYINGKFTAQPTTGVQRAACSIVLALDRLQVESPGASAMRWVLLCPPRAAHIPSLQYVETRIVGRAGIGLHAWEQWRLPLETRGAWLVNLAGAAPLLKRRQLCTFHDAAVFDCPQSYTPLFAAWYRLLFRRIGRSAPLLLTVSEYSKGRLAERLPIDPSRVRVLGESAEHMNAVEADPSVLASMELRPGAYFLAVGSHSQAKNLATLREAHARLAGRCEARLVIVGGRSDGVFSRAVADAEAAAGVLHVGRVTDPQLKALYQSALAFVFPSVYEGFGLPPLEAMACGCPVIASNAASIPEVCGDAALFVDPRDPGAMAESMLRLSGDARLRDELRARGQARSAGFSWQAAARRLVEAVRSVGAPVPARP